MIDLTRLRKYIDDESEFPLFYRLKLYDNSDHYIVNTWARDQNGFDLDLKTAINKVAVKYALERGEDMALYRGLGFRKAGGLCNKLRNETEDMNEH